MIDLKRAHNFGIDSSSDLEQEHMKTSSVDELPLQGTFCPENLAITVCQTLRDKNRDFWKTLNLSSNFYLPPLNDEVLRHAIFAGENGQVSVVEETDYYAFCFSIWCI